MSKHDSSSIWPWRAKQMLDFWDHLDRIPENDRAAHQTDALAVLKEEPSTKDTLERVEGLLNPNSRKDDGCWPDAWDSESKVHNSFKTALTNIKKFGAKIKNHSARVDRRPGSDAGPGAKGAALAQEGKGSEPRIQPTRNSLPESVHPSFEASIPNPSPQPMTPPRKRQLDSDDDDAEPQAEQARTTRPTSEPAPLTRQNLARFNKMGKKKSSDPSDDSSSTTSTTSKTGSTSTKFDDKGRRNGILKAHKNGILKARNNGILDERDSRLAKNLKDIRQQQAKSRASASPPESVYNNYVKRVDVAGNKATMIFTTGKLLLKECPTMHLAAYNLAFKNLPKDAGFNNGLSAPQPDFIEGLEKEEYRPFPVDDFIPEAALSKDNPYSITLPQIAGEWTGPDGDIKETNLQSAYYGAAMVYLRNKALAYMGKEDPPGHASVNTFATDGKTLNLFAHYAAPSEDHEGALKYHQCLVSSTSLTSSYESFKEGRKQLRNAQDQARAQSNALKDQLKEHYKQQRGGGDLHPVATGVPPLPVPAIEPLNAYEDEGDHEVVEQQRKASSSQSSHGSSAPVSKHGSC
ncbi:hypothetical protein B0T16DRAFT_450942 [Cercophora newfieldiana]|uniref:Uncharacterized protein n=1 Tax=Cercophora newfieldiana TaxID=92897 RepID=A0AA39YME6_9PEZI|nr:hypothetical protein B0T16DRAFT_450942 [Cercophora newfieldiana]